MSAGASEARLHFVGDAKPAGGTDGLIDLLEVAVREENDSAHPLNRLRDEAGHAAGRSEIEQLLDVRGVLSAGFRIDSTVGPSVRIRHSGMMDTKAVRHVELPGPVGGEPHGA